MTTVSSSSASSTSASTSTSAAASSSTTSNAALGQSILSSLNANGSSIDTGALVTNLTAAQKSALETPITTKQTQNTAQISSLATITSDLSAFASVFSSLASGGTLQTQPTSSNTSVMTVAAVAGTPVGDLSSTIAVSQLAQAQTLKTKSFAASDTFGSGTLSVTIGSGSAVPITLGSGTHSLADIASAINAQKPGITAVVVTNSDGSGSLVIKGGTGAAQSFAISGADDGTAEGTQSLASLSYSGSDTSTVSENQIAQDAKLTVDGVALTRSSNSFSDVLPGVTMNLTSIGTTSLGSSRPTDAISSAVSTYVSDYNILLGDIKTATAAATSCSSAGSLRGNQALRQLQDQLARMTTTPLNASGSVRTLAELGVKTAQDGTLSLDSSVLSKVITAYPDDVVSMFNTSQSSSSSKVLITGDAGSAASGVYTVTGISPTSDGNPASGSINGVPMSASSWKLTAVSGNQANGLLLQILSGAPTTATITINQGLAGLLGAISSTSTASNGLLGTLSTSLTTQQTSLADALTKADAQVTTYQNLMTEKFSQMNTLVSGYKATSSYLTQQVALWSKSS